MESKQATIKIEKRSDYISARIAGDLEYGIIEDVKKVLQSQKPETEYGYILDMQSVTNIDSTWFGMIVNFAKKVLSKEKRIVIIVADEFIRNLFSISQCDKVFPIARNESEALHLLKENNWTGELSINDY